MRRFKKLASAYKCPEMPYEAYFDNIYTKSRKATSVEQNLVLRILI